MDSLFEDCLRDAVGDDAASVVCKALSCPASVSVRLNPFKWSAGERDAGARFDARHRRALDARANQPRAAARDEHVERALLPHELARALAGGVLDELDEFLSPRYSARILEFLKEKFPWADWLVSTHSCDLIANSSDANLIVLDDGECEVIDINDYSSVSEVQIIFERLFGKIENEEDAIDGKLRRLLNNKINNAWKDSDEKTLKGLQQEQLTASQSVILRQIQEW